MRLRGLAIFDGNQQLKAFARRVRRLGREFEEPGEDARRPPANLPLPSLA